jgi:hypothetical protein
MKIRCPHCCKSIGGAATDGGFRLRLGIVLVDPDNGEIHGPCPSCKQDVVVAVASALNKGLLANKPGVIPALRVRRG